MDFGLARMRVADHKTSTGIVLGTPRYMSPEQISGQPVDQRSDIFSLGIVVWELLTGRRLFSGTEMAQVSTASPTTSTCRRRASIPSCRRCSTSWWRAR